MSNLLPTLSESVVSKFAANCPTFWVENQQRIVWLPKLAPSVWSNPKFQTMIKERYGSVVRLAGDKIASYVRRHNNELEKQQGPITRWIDKNADQLSYLYFRWQEEKEFEDWRGYGAKIQSLFKGSGIKFVRANSRPFFIIVEHDLTEYQISIMAAGIKYEKLPG